MATINTKNRLSFDKTLVDRKAIEKEFEQLLDEPGCNELSVKPFFEQYPFVIPTPWLLNHRIHFDFMFPQLPISTASRTDFVYLTKSSASWWCVLIEIESPNAKLFHEKSRTVKFHSDLTAALDQIRDWRDYLAEHADAFLSQLSPIRIPLERNPVEFRYVLVIGRRREFYGDRAKTMRFSRLETGKDSPDLRVMTYDAVLSDFAYRQSTRLGPFEDYDLLARSGTRFRFTRYVPREANFWGWLTPAQLDITTDQLSKASEAGNSIDKWLKDEKVITRVVPPMPR